MMDPVRELKVRAELLHRQVQDAQPLAVERLRVLPELRKVQAQALAEATLRIQRKHCLAVVGREAGFSSWEHARQVLLGEAVTDDFGTLLCPPGRGTYLNHWVATYDGAREVHRGLLEAGETRYLLGFKRQFFIAESGYVESVGLDPDDPDWRAIGWDWARPRSVAARKRLYAKLLAPAAAA